MCYLFTCPLMATGLSKVPCIPNIADCGGLIMGVPMRDPKTPPLLTVKVPPSISSTSIAPLLAFSPSDAIVFSMSAYVMSCTLRTTGTNKPCS